MIFTYFCIMENEQHLEALKRLLCEAAGCESTHSSDFIVMMAYVRNRTKQAIGVNTLKRFYNYGGESATPRSETLNVLAQSLGYRNYTDFCEHYQTDSDAQSSDVVLGAHIATKDLRLGQNVRLRWNPGRECLIEYLGNDTFRVVESQQTKLAAGDTFQASFFALGHTALLANLIHGDSSFPLYEIGKKRGLTLVEIASE